MGGTPKPNNAAYARFIWFKAPVPDNMGSLSAMEWDNLPKASANLYD